MDPRNILEHSKIHFSRDWFDLPVTSDDLTNYYKDTDESKFVVIISHDHRTVASCVAATTRWVILSETKNIVISPEAPGAVGFPDQGSTVCSPDQNGLKIRISGLFFRSVLAFSV